MAITATTVIAIASVAASTGTAAYQSHKAGEATKAQQDAVNQGMALQKEQWAQAQANLAPQLEAGRTGLVGLNYAMGGGGGGASPVIGQPQAKTGLGDFATPEPSRALQPTATMGRPQTMVTMRAPDGSRARVPATDIQKYQAKGAVLEGAGGGGQTASGYSLSQMAR